jgi:hypothetical protein
MAAPRGDRRDHVSHVGGKDTPFCDIASPALQVLQARIGWISGRPRASASANVPLADAGGRHLHAPRDHHARGVWSPVCDDIACKCAGVDGMMASLESLWPGIAPRAMARTPGGAPSGWPRRAWACAIKRLPPW